jgi:oligopeptide transport system permease protein
MASETWHTLRANRPAIFGLGVILALSFLALFAPLVQHHDPMQIHPDRIYEGPSWTFWLGTDRLGRDQWARLVHGARVSLAVGVFSQLLAASLGLIAGMAAGLGGKRSDGIIMRMTDLAFAFPDLLLVILLVSWFGQSVSMLVLAIALVSSTTIARLVRAQTLSLREREFVVSTRALGASEWRIAFRHIFPNVLGPVIAVATFGVPAAIFAEAALGYMGMGYPPPAPSWGDLAHQSLVARTVAPHLMVTSCLAIALTMLSFTLVGDALRDALDPKARPRRRRASTPETIELEVRADDGPKRRAA